MNNNFPILQMTLYTTTGWGISLAAVESVARIVSLVVPVVLSILVYRNSLKNKNKKGEK